ncbi:LytR/AlgR family response regulator transcription factor [Extibacter muris]|uniref:LytR/AlgR family response regulator transcription factor n=1 Tax=Extibacter muris TaxID=1796622 RepID=UPI001D06F441|nr:LytTR family DNA-binding domain-containing protein [Extibacter muris]MCB6203795.1 LytTR family DNA-binding domain-containing protein [Extibacter muris]MCQ4665463.1 LytTR family DNA-binding domain-containing protein [Extibacter muris]MCQ4695010.1 LytTR family DNA-binding domain-containing protein [Extibacter muris]
MISIAVCEDDDKELEQICAYIKEYIKRHPDKEISLECFHTGMELIEEMEKGRKFNICLLDILMPGMDGMELGRAIRQDDGLAVIIYLTSSPDFALESYRIRAMDYILKPCSEEELAVRLDEACQRFESDSMCRFLLHVPEGQQAIPLTRIVCVEYYGHRLYLHLTDCTTVKSVLYRKPFSDIAAPFSADMGFIQISASHIVNMRHIQKVGRNTFTLSDGELLTITRKYTEAKKKYMDYILERRREL